MEAIEAIMTRTSVRNFTQRPVSDKDLETILKAGMSGPSCVNARQWSFVVVRNKETLQKMAEVNGQYAWPLTGADVGILVCGDLERAYPGSKDYWIIDASIACQNMTLAAHGLGLGSVWLGTYPEENKFRGQAELFHLPKTIVPHSILGIGYPAKPPVVHPDKPEWEADRVHYEAW